MILIYIINQAVWNNHRSVRQSTKHNQTQVKQSSGRFSVVRRRWAEWEGTSLEDGVFFFPYSAASWMKSIEC